MSILPAKPAHQNIGRVNLLLEPNEFIEGGAFEKTRWSMDSLSNPANQVADGLANRSQE